MSWTDRKPFQVTDDIEKSYKRLKKRFNCKLCGKDLVCGDTARWIYANSGDSPVRCGNFFTCSNCDGSDNEVLSKAALSFGEAVGLAKQWDIYGPEWQQDLL